MLHTGDFAISTDSLTKTYKGVEALRSLDLKVPRNSIFGFLGPNGAGKSTAIRLLLGLIKPTSGGGSVFGLDIVHDSPRIRERIGYLPLKFSVLLPVSSLTGETGSLSAG